MKNELANMELQTTSGSTKVSQADRQLIRKWLNYGDLKHLALQHLTGYYENPQNAAYRIMCGQLNNSNFILILLEKAVENKTAFQNKIEILRQ